MSDKYKDLNRPFDPALLDQAREIVNDYRIVLWQEEGHWYGNAEEYPEGMGDGKTPATCVKHTRDSLVVGVATMLEAGQRPPMPGGSAKRTEQVNVRLTVHERRVLERVAGARGFKGLGDFVRAAALDHAK